MYRKAFATLSTSLFLFILMTGFSGKGGKTIASLAVEETREHETPLAGHLPPALFERGRTTCIYIDNKDEKQVVYSAFSMLQNDARAVFNADLQWTDDKTKARIIVRSPKELQGEWETFRMSIQDDKLFIDGSDARGKAYGILELSRVIGVSPWEWWADVTPAKRDACLLSEIKKGLRSPSVQYRGIFLNDEDWGLLPWATRKFRYELVDGVTLADNPRWKGAIAPECYERIFQLLLRLRANAIWPAMHECTVPFYFVKGNKEMADKYGIVVGTSHCEPLMRNSASEWDVSGKGDYNFITNRQHVLDYWTERLKELQHSENIFTIGMRGKHDGMMQGVRTPEEHKNALSRIIPAQQDLLERHLSNPGKIQQVFIPYKEVLEVYDAGLEVPDHVTLVWCDDNYGYLRRLSAAKEQSREGGAGVYYHVSYWGQPHDYLWLASTSPALVYTEMKRAYEHQARTLWMLNVGDIKPAEYLTELFMDLAWDVESVKKEKGLFGHLRTWAEREFGKRNAEAITSVMKGYYRLASVRKPEFTGWSRVEEPGYRRGGLTPVKDSEYNPAFNNELQQRVDDYLSLERQVAEIGQNIPDDNKSAFFQLVEYPVRCASLINRKWLYRQLSDYVLETGDTEGAKRYATESVNAHDLINTLTTKYNALGNGKWSGIMDSRPRDLPVFESPSGFPEREEHAPPVGRGWVKAFNADNATNLKTKGTEGLGHSFSAVEMKKGQVLEFTFEVPETGEYFLKVGTIPNHDVDGAGMKIEVLLNNKIVAEADYSVKGRSETWKRNVLRGQAISSIKLNIEQPGEIRISIKARTEYVILDQIMLVKNEMNFYEFPVRTKGSLLTLEARRRGNRHIICNRLATVP
ncbi:MAG: glycosyl hydrolase 115 family protein [Odoribacteraceae bacterium]|jgi:hypothetical protein|nr:glycosyl hydrolase 115 family protein [Odoribacteraceae bacterium]